MISLLFSVLCLSLGFVLIYAGVAKLKSFKEFKIAVSDLELVQESWVGLVSISVIVTELILGLVVVLGIKLRTTLLISLGVTITMYLVSRLSGKLDTHSPCLCFGADGVLVTSWKSKARTALLIVGTAVALVGAYQFPTEYQLILSLESVALTLSSLLILSWALDFPAITQAKRYMLDTAQEAIPMGD